MFDVKIIADSITRAGKRLTTLTACFPRSILSEVNTHRDRARNAASSRAIRFPVMTQAIEDNPFIPLAWGLEQSGMQAGGDIPDKMKALAEQIWLEARDAALFHAKRLHNIGQAYAARAHAVVEDGDSDVKIHKSIPNRILEPWMWTTQVMSATEWSNFFRLRCHPDAEIHFQKIAGMMRDALSSNLPRLLDAGEWHLPFVFGNDLDSLRSEGFTPEEICQISVARCARVSYLTHNGIRDPRKDITLFERLVQGSGFGHWSAHEHVARAEASASHMSGPYRGWHQYRKDFALECG